MFLHEDKRVFKQLVEEVSKGIKIDVVNCDKDRELVNRLKRTGKI